MADLFSLSDDIIRSGEAPEKPFARVNHELSELDNDLGFVEAFSNSVTFNTDDGIVVFDASSHRGGQLVVESIRRWKPASRFNALIYTHGHVDHVGGSHAFVQAAEGSGSSRLEILGHDNIKPRFDRYRLTNGYNQVINSRQFGTDIRGSFLPDDVADPTLTYSDFMSLNRGGLDIELHHAKGETDDHTWGWIPKYKAICAGDFFIWVFPNAGNPQKVQRYPVEWAAAMRAMLEKEPEMLLPAHGLPIRGKEQVGQVLDDLATVLEFLVENTLSMMNQGARLNDIVHTVKLDSSLLGKPYLAPLYDEPEFTINNIWRMYGGWYNGNPAQLKPAADKMLSAEVAQLAGGSEALAKRALDISSAGDHRLACHLIEFATTAEPDNLKVHEIRNEIYQRRVKAETSLMAKGIFGHAARESANKTSVTSD